MKLNIAILGTRGIPNNYGGFEQFAEHLSVGLVERGHSVTVYNSHLHPYKKNNWNGVEIVHCYDPEFLIGTAGQFIYDLNCIIDARKKKFDAILQLGYTSSSVWGWLYPKKSMVITNMDGLEWKRSKYARPVQQFLKYAEKLAIKFSDHHIADSLEIQKYLVKKYNIDIRYIPYGADLLTGLREETTEEYNIKERNFSLLIARIEPENNIETILQGVHNSSSDKKFIVIGDTGNKFGKHLVDKFKKDTRVNFAGAVYNTAKLHTLRASSSLYFHGHSVGGTNPSLLEAMASKALIAAHYNPFNKSVLEENAFYFSTSNDVKKIIETATRGSAEECMINNNFNKICTQFNWEDIITRYEIMLAECCGQKKKADARI